MRKLFFILFLISFQSAFAQIDTTIAKKSFDSTALRIKNFAPFFNLQVDSSLTYKLFINKKYTNYYWYLKNAPAGVRINKDEGILSIAANKSYFLSGKLKYDIPYEVKLTVQNLENPNDKIDTSFTVQYYNTEIILPKLKPTITSEFIAEEGDTINFKIQCLEGSFDIDELTILSNYPIHTEKILSKCGDAFVWFIPFDFIKSTDREKTKVLQLQIIGNTKSQMNDTARIRITVKDNINYPEQVAAFNELQTEAKNYILQLKSSFRVVDKKIKRTKSVRTSFDLTSASTALTGTILSTLPETKQASTGKILPSVGVALVPVKEAAAPNNTYDQNMATLIRSSIKRLQYIIQDTKLVGERDPEILSKQKRLKDEMTQTQVQLIDIPITYENYTEEELDKYFNSPKVQKKYKMTRK